MIKFLVSLIRLRPSPMSALKILRRSSKVLSLITFGAGVYAGIYITQNYEVPRVDEPSKIWEKVKDYADSHKKDK